MALPATHVRYALERMPPALEPHCGAVIAGTLYPDSRMLTGISRDQTHADACLSDDFAVSPFRLGWQLHCRCDRIQAEIHARIWPAAARLPDPQRWIAMSAAKMVQDEADRARIPLRAHLVDLTPDETPWGENPETITRFYSMIRDVYAATEIPPGERFIRLWDGVGLEPALIDKLMRAYAELKADAALAGRIAASMSALLADRASPADASACHRPLPSQ
jgi:hypothetical protein